MAASTNNDRQPIPTQATVHVLLRLALLALAKGKEHKITLLSLPNICSGWLLSSNQGAQFWPAEPPLLCFAAATPTLCLAGLSQEQPQAARSRAPVTSSQSQLPCGVIRHKHACGHSKAPNRQGTSRWCLAELTHAHTMWTATMPMLVWGCAAPPPGSAVESSRMEITPCATKVQVGMCLVCRHTCLVHQRAQPGEVGLRGLDCLLVP